MWKVRNVQLDAGSYYIRLYEGSRRKKIKLGRVDEFTTKQQLETAAEEVRGRHHKVPKRKMTLSQFIRFFYLPVAEQRVRPVTYKGYLTIYTRHIKPLTISDRKLWTFTTVEVRQLLGEVASARDLTKMTLRHIKAFLSGVFRQAIEMGFFAGANPVHESSLPWKGRPSADTHAYSLEEIRSILPKLPLQARAVFAIAAFAGLRRSEIQGLERGDYDGERLQVRRSVVQGHEDAPKSRASRSWVPVIAPLRAILDEYLKDAPTGKMFDCPLGYLVRTALRDAGGKGYKQRDADSLRISLSWAWMISPSPASCGIKEYRLLAPTTYSSAMLSWRRRCQRWKTRYGNGTDQVAGTS